MRSSTTPPTLILLALVLVATLITLHADAGVDVSIAIDINSFSKLFSSRIVPSTNATGNGGCIYISTPQPEDNVGQAWSCAAGNFCMSPSHKAACEPGFYCPMNTAQPLYCCTGFYCPTPRQIELCPQGYYCPVGSAKPFPCNLLASCPPGTGYAYRYGIGVILAVILVLVSIGFFIKSRRDSRSAARYARLLLDYDTGGPTSHVAPASDAPDVSDEHKFCIQFNDISYTVPQRGLKVLRGVSGTLRSGRLCAIIGPSGSGKTTLLNVIAGRIHDFSGNIFINGVRESLRKVKKLVGHVPQDDIMHRELRVMDVLMYSALGRLPASMSREEKVKVVLTMITYLGLEEIADYVIGTEEHRGISGGQRKRVNIGIELVAKPSILLLDEPTSGLDSSTAIDITGLLADLAHQQQLLVAAIVHSPGIKTFGMFDDVLVLGKGGGVVYFGPREQAPAYFESIGFPLPPGANPADHYVAVCSEKVPSNITSGFAAVDLLVYWKRYCYDRDPTSYNRVSIASSSDENIADQTFMSLVRPRKMGLGPLRAVRGVLLAFWSYVVDVAAEFTDWFRSSILRQRYRHGRKTANGWILFRDRFERALRQIFRSSLRFVRDQMLHLACGVFISLASRQMDYYGRQPDDVCRIAPFALQDRCRQPFELISYVGVLVSLGVYFAGITAGTSTFGSEKTVFWRESAAGLAALPYFIAKVAADVIRVLFAALFFTLSLVLFLSYRSTFWQIYLVVWCLYLSAFAIGYFVSFVTTRRAYGLLATVFALVWGVVLSGVLPDLAQVSAPKSTLSGLVWLWQISAPRYAVEAFFLAETSARPFTEIQSGVLPHAFRLSNFWVDIVAMVVLAVAWQLAGFLAMKLTDRRQQL